MKKIIFILGCILVSHIGYTQHNLVDNYSFENVLSGFSCGASSNVYSDLMDYWNHIPPWTTPNYKDFCIQGHQVGSSDCICNSGHTGTHSGFANYHEYIMAPLNTQMEPGKVYYVEYYVRGSEIRHNSGIKFFEDRPKQCLTNEITGDGNADVGIFDPVSFGAWTKVSSYFTANHPYNWIGLGSFNTGDHTEEGPAYYFDDIQVIKVGSSICPDANYIQNSIFHDIGKIIYRSQNLTISGKNIASTLSQGNVVIGSTAIVDFKSATKVILEDGFSTDLGAHFDAYIAPCDADCFPPVANAGPDATSCGAQTVSLGGASEFGNTYSWTASPASALAYLSGTHVSNPVFTPPASGNGVIHYTLTVGNTCNQSASDQVLIKYEANPNNIPTVSASNINYSDMIEFDAAVGIHTGQLIIELWTVSGSLVNTFTYNAGVDFTCCNYHWKIPSGMNPCVDYKIKLYTKNLCSNVLSAPVTINWVRNRTLNFTQVANVFTPNGDGVNDLWGFTFTGGSAYNVLIKNPSGVSVYQNNGLIMPPSAFVWNGACNQPACSQSTVPNGTYYYVLTMTGCSGNDITHNGFINLFH